MNSGVRIFTRVDPGHKGVEIRVNLDQICLYMPFRPDPKKPEVAGVTAISLSNGFTFAAEISIKSLDQILGVNKR